MKRMVTQKMFNWLKSAIEFTAFRGSTFEVGGNLEVDGAIQTNSQLPQVDVGYIELNIPDSATNGTLTEEQIQILKTNDLVEIRHGVLRYHLASDHTTEGYRIYIAQDYVFGSLVSKVMTVTISTRAFVIN